MSDNVYEGMFILDSLKYAQNPDATQKEVLGLLERCGANLLVSRPWQDAKLAYPIEKHKKGLYFLAYFKMDPTKLTELYRLCKLNETVVRQLVLKVDPLLVEPLVQMASSDGGTYSRFVDTGSDDGTDSPRGGDFEGRDRDRGRGRDRDRDRD